MNITQPETIGKPASARVRGFFRALRLPAALAILFAFKAPVLLLAEWAGGLDVVTESAIAVLSTGLVRGYVALGLTVLLVAAYWLFTKTLRGWTAKAAVLGLATLVFATVLIKTFSSLWWMVPPLAVLSTNWAIEQSPKARRFADSFVPYAIGLGELLSFQAFLRWVQGENREGYRPTTLAGIAQAVPMLIAGTLLAVSLSTKKLVGWERVARFSPPVRVLARGDYNWIELVDDDKKLLVTGHGLRRLRRYDLSATRRSYDQTNADTVGAQGFAYDPKAREVYVYNSQLSKLMIFDSARLQLSGEIPVSGLAPGDVWIAVEPSLQQIVLSSEMDELTGEALTFIDRRTGQKLEHRSEDPGTILLHPARPLLYMSFFRRGAGVMAYDLTSRKIVSSTYVPGRLDRIAFNAGANEILVASPLTSSVLRFAADSLAPHGEIPANFGVRALAIDAQRNLLFTGSLTTGTLWMIDLATGRRLKRYYLGPWLRTIVVAASRGTAYVSSNGGLYEVHYASVGAVSPGTD